MIFKFFFFFFYYFIDFTSSTPLTCTNRDGKETFRIIQFTDTHFGESSVDDASSQIEFKSLISMEQPDLIALSGDVVSGYAYTNGDPTPWWPTQFDNAIKPIIDSKTYWAYTLGNHDDQGDYNRTQIIEYAIIQNYSLTQRGPSDIGGVSNYVLTVFDSSNTNAIANIWFMDSLDETCYNVEGYNCVQLTTVSWYIETSQNLEAKYGKKLPGIVYIHIPLPELLFLWNNFNSQGTLKDDGVCCWSLNTGLFAAMKSRGDIVSVWHGHDHKNDFQGNYHNITLGYGRKTGFGGYTSYPLSRGTRVIEITCNNNTNINNVEWKTWIREDNGTIVYNQTDNKAQNWETFQECCASLGNRNLDEYGNILKKEDNIH